MQKNNERLAKDWLLIADGEPLTLSRLSPYLSSHHIIVLDGAYHVARELQLPIDILLGDFDSIKPEALEEARTSGIDVVHTPNQNYTDLEKAIHHLDQLQAISILLCATTGRRLQHTLYNLRSLKKYYRSDRQLRLLTATEMIEYIENKLISIVGVSGESIGIMGFSSATISSEGLQYDMDQRLLDFEKFSSVSNALAKEQATINVRGAALLIREI